MSDFKTPIYLDYLSTTPVDPRVAEAMAGCLTMDGVFGNPASRSHGFGWRAESVVEDARSDVAELINADPREIVWTSGATESDNLAIKGVAHQHRERGRHLITSMMEHKAVLDTCAQLEREGFSVTYLRPDDRGLITAEMVQGALRDDTVLVSIMHANNEVGTVNDIASIGAVCRGAGVLYHVDAAQSAGKIPLDMDATAVDLLSMSAHKLYGPKGIGALYVRRRPRVRIEAQIHGGGHERGMRSGTLPTHQIAGFGMAARIARETMAAEIDRLTALRARFWEGIRDLPGVSINGDESARLPGALNIAFPGVEGDALMLSMVDLAVSSGSACTSESIEPSYVLRAMGLSDDLAHSSLRFSFGRFTQPEDVEHAIVTVRHAVEKLREPAHATGA
ncbi:MAG: IscS subfamily cysteine desulfurase [Halieaceae bacterium]|nr:IscS subfamily cysteine desulfurase [Halieaceae bacterium]